MVRKLVIFLILLGVQASAWAQEGQVVRGEVVDAVTQAPLPGASVVVLNSDPQLGTITDENGKFRLWDIQPGRYNLLVSFIGYENYLFREVLVGSGKEIVLKAALQELTEQLEEVKIVARTSKEQPLNTMATISARQLSVEEANRYAGGYDDPARLAGSFAGVASEIGNNGIVVRGNSPRNLLWCMEGVEIANPTHFANVIAFGAGGITALSSHMLANSDFYTGAFPAEYGNALSGVFDVRLRNGNNETYEHAFKAGVTGLDFSSEGPLKKGGASYLFNYRYSTYALLGSLIPEEAGDIGYQDFSFKLNFPTKRMGNFTLWGIGALDDQERDPLEDQSEWETVQDKEGYALDLATGAIGLTHKVLFNQTTYLHTTLAASGNRIETVYDELDEGMDLQPKERVNNNTSKYTFTSTLNHKFGVHHANRTGVVVNRHHYNVDNRETVVLGEPLVVFADEEGDASSVQAYSQSMVNLSTQVKLNLGVHLHYFSLNDEVSVEPRVGLKWQFNPNQSLGFAYGLNSRIEMIGFYMARQQTDNGIIQPNKGLKMTKAHHWGLAYDINLNRNTRLKIEPYFQYLYDVPVVPDSYFSLQNLEMDWFFNETLVNDGTGTNLGVDFTLEHFLTNGFYYLATASLFDSRYKGGDGIERNSLYNKNYLLNLLAGKEWQLGKNDANTLSLNGRMTWMGGDRYTPLLVDESMASGELTYDYSRAYTKQEDPALVVSFSLSYRKNKPKHASIWSFHLLNALGNEEYRDYEFNLQNGRPEKQFDRIVVPNLSYKIEF
ncbi:TonB-dependent receptor [Sunxiuqinia elliptica]|uniref:Outer membrane receptor protein involved in Fe transport n=1 Tax=Sunxiuqinia elliptica TaxID=655355 RepID=A0A4R6H8S5_9BACT|nr:TonB-dependent receptor [Sunxiuqinia elliptica]TDO04006.1 outer membrane receptor protein involved in Fe transport [Sunxiuqinia elliptica]TDO62288.1 outer membrane receptor protein involved in Fe transport [Sunxiuqinia elliptica]